jgi:hypothetical protein
MQTRTTPDLIVEQCPMGCSQCAGIYVNVQTGHRIVCKCICHYYEYNPENPRTTEKNEENLMKSELLSASSVASPERLAPVTSKTLAGEETDGR